MKILISLLFLTSLAAEAYGADAFEVVGRADGLLPEEAFGGARGAAMGYADLIDDEAGGAWSNPGALVEAGRRVIVGGAMTRAYHDDDADLFVVDLSVVEGPFRVSVAGRRLNETIAIRTAFEPEATRYEIEREAYGAGLAADLMHWIARESAIDWTLGLNVRRQTDSRFVDDPNATALDLGSAVAWNGDDDRVLRRIAFGASLWNVNSAEFTSEGGTRRRLGRAFRAGASVSLASTHRSRGHTTLAGSLVAALTRPIDDDDATALHVGAEVVVQDALVFRLGHHDLLDLDAFAAGVGVRFVPSPGLRIEVDATWEDWGETTFANDPVATWIFGAHVERAFGSAGD